MKCTLDPNIKSASGKLGNLLFKTFTKPDGTKEVRAYGMPRRKDGSFGYERKAKPSKAEIASRHMFETVAGAIKALTEEQRMQYAREWKTDHHKLNGKVYGTLRGYIMARIYDDMKKNRA